LPALDNVNEDGTNKSETKTTGKSASVGPATPNMPKADDSVAASGIYDFNFHDMCNLFPLNF